MKFASFWVTTSLTVLATTILVTPQIAAQSKRPDTLRGDRMLAAYFRDETQRLAQRCQAAAASASAWEKHRDEYRRQLFEMFSLDPLPERTDLKPVVTGRLERDGIVVEKLHFQSRPGLYVTANLYRPAKVEEPLPTVLYVCGHSAAKKGKVCFGNKCNYTHHGSWLARNGYVCLTIDTLQLGEIEGIHHGTKRFDRWWWLCRGYVPSGVEAWNCIRALDYLETRPEVDSKRMGVTGRSGGGAYSWSIAALDDRIQAAVPVAGIVDLQSYVVDDVIEGHCDCMFFLNTYQWDYPMLAALAAPRPVLLANSDKDRIFPLGGVLRVHDYTRQVYRKQKAGGRFGLQISEGPHKDIPELQVAAFRWLNRFLKKEDPPIEHAAVKLFTPEELKVFDELPDDEINTRIDELFVPRAETPLPPQSASDWNQQHDAWLQTLREKCFRAWPDETSGGETAQAASLDVQEVSSTTNNGVRLRSFDFTTQPHVRLRLWVFERDGLDRPDAAVLNVLDEKRWPEFLAAMKNAFPEEFSGESLSTQHDAGEAAFEKIRTRLEESPHVLVYVTPRGIGPSAWNTSGKNRVEIPRRFMLLGQTLDGMQAYDIRRACQAVRSSDDLHLRDVPIWLEAHDQMAGNALYASLFEPEIARLDLHRLPHSHDEGPFYLNVLRFLDVPQAVAMAAEQREVHLYEDAGESDEDEGTAKDLPGAWAYPQAVQTTLQWPADRLQIHSVMPARNPD